MRPTRNVLPKITVVVGLLIVQSSFEGGTTNAQTSATVKVKCAQGDSINKAIGQHPNAESLVVEISGMCSENVVVTRDRVTLRGTDPAGDGIQAALNASQIDAALWVKGAHLVTVENLKLTGGFDGLLATEATTPFLVLSNCRLEGNNRGTVLEASLLQAEDTVFTANTTFNALVFLGSRFGCTRCTLSDPGAGLGSTVRTNLVLGTGSTALVFDSTFSDGGIHNGDSTVTVADSTIDGFAPNASVQGVHGTFMLTRVQVGGPMRFGQSSNAQLSGVTQTRSESPGNTVDDSSYVRIADAAPATGGPPSITSTLLGFSLRNFSNGSLLQTSQINGNLNCGSGANAFCANPSNVSGTSSCALCPKP